METTKIKAKWREGLPSLENFYMGILMKEMRGKIDVDSAREIIRKEILSRFEVVEPEKRGGEWIVRKREES
jgi:hypothetical protein